MEQENSLQLLEGLFCERGVKNYGDGGGMASGELKLQSDATGCYWAWEGVTVWLPVSQGKALPLGSAEFQTLKMLKQWLGKHWVESCPGNLHIGWVAGMKSL